MYCGYCQVLQIDLSRMDPFTSLKDFLIATLLAGKGTVSVTKDGQDYEVIAMPAKGKATLVCTAQALPKSVDIPTNIPVRAANKSSPLLLPLIITLKAANAQMKTQLAAFAKNYRNPNVTITVK